MNESFNSAGSRPMRKDTESAMRKSFCEIEFESAECISPEGPISESEAVTWP